MKAVASVLLVGVAYHLAFPSLFAEFKTLPSNLQPGTNATPTSAVMQLAPLPGPLASTPSAAAASPGFTTNFLALPDYNTISPPDTDGAVGPNHVMTMINTQVRIQTRDGTTLYTDTLLNWWSSVGGFSFVFSPRVLYDPYQNRWIATAGTDVLQPSAAILVAVSATGDPAGVWYRHRYPVDANGLFFADFPTVGFNKDTIVVSWNYLDNATETNQSTGIAMFDKNGMYAGQPNPYYDLATLDYATYGSTHVPAVTYDANLAAVYLVQDLQDNPSGSSYLSIYAITGSSGVDQISQLSFFPAASAWATRANNDAGLGPQAGTAVRIHLVDDRMGQVIYRHGALWCAHTIFLPAVNPTHTAVQWWQIDPANNLVVQNGRITDPAGVKSYAFPSIAVNRFKDVLIGYSTFSPNQYPSAAYSFHACNDTNNTMESEVVLKAGIAPYYKTIQGRNRWGDYSATWTDPLNDSDFWTLQEYADMNVGLITTDGSGRWATWWGNVPVALPGNDYFTNAWTLTGGQGITNGTVVRATRESGEPSHGGNTNTPSVWYRWTAPGNGRVTFDATNRGTSFSMVLALYTGTNVSALTLKTNATGAAPTVGFSAASNVTYQIAVAGLNGSCGDFTLHFIQPTPPLFAQNPVSTNLVANASENASFNSLAVGLPDPAYQWKFYGTNSIPATNNIATATNAAYTITNVRATNAGNYFCVATNAAGSATSGVATLFVQGSSAGRLNLLGDNGTSFWFQVSGLTNRSYVVQTSTNLNRPTNWRPIYTNYVSYFYTNFISTNDRQRFYRSITNN